MDPRFFDGHGSRRIGFGTDVAVVVAKDKGGGVYSVSGLTREDIRIVC